MRFLKDILVLLALMLRIKSSNKLQNDVGLVVSSLKIGQTTYQAVEGYIGVGSEATKLFVSFQYNFSRKKSIIGNFERVYWGISCKDTDAQYINSCRITNDEEKADFYEYNTFKYKDASLYYRFNNIDKLVSEGIEPLPVQLVTGGQRWSLESLGVLGLAPYGDFAGYVKRMWEDNTGLLFAYEAIEDSSSNQDISYKTHVVLNPVFDESGDNIILDMDEKAESWAHLGDVSMEGTELDYTNTKVCFTSLANELILIVDSEELCDTIRGKICKNLKIKDCTKTVADLSLAPDMKFTFKKKILIIEAEDYIYFDMKEIVNCRFGDITAMRSKGACDSDTEVAVGKTFFQRIMPALFFNKDGSSRLYLVPRYQFDEPVTTSWMVICGICGAIGVAIIIFILLKRKRDNDDMYFATST